MFQDAGVTKALGRLAPLDACEVERPGRRRRAAGADVRALIGLAMLWTWVWLRSWGPSMSLWGGSVWVTELAFRFDHGACALALAFAMALSKLLDIRRVLKPAVVGGASLCAAVGVGLAGAFAMGWDGGSPSGFHTAAALSGLLTGAARGLALYAWGSVLVLLDMRRALLVNLASLVASAIIYYACRHAPVSVEVAVGVVFGALGPLLAITRVPGPSTRPPGHPKLSPRVFVEGGAAALIVLAALVIGTDNGFVAGMYELLPQTQPQPFSYGRIPATIAAAALAYGAARLLGNHLTARTMQIGVPIVALACLVLPYEAQPTLGRFLGILGYQFLMTVFWIVLWPPPSRRGARGRPGSLALLALLCGTTVGFLVWDFAGGAQTTWNMQAVSAVAMFVLVVLEACLAPSAVEVAPSAPVVAADPGDAADSIARDPGGSDSVQLLSERYGLTPREAQVCRLLGRGRSRQYIADALGVSLQTARTHVTNVYRKLGVHTQQEFLDLYEAPEQNGVSPS